MAVEGIALKKAHFGPYPHGAGEYSYMSWDQARAIANKLITLGLLKIDSQSRYTWTMLGKRILKKLAEKDAQIPEHEL
jgi:hypothetical protein